VCQKRYIRPVVLVGEGGLESNLDATGTLSDFLTFELKHFSSIKYVLKQNMNDSYMPSDLLVERSN
jgi:hypothetical protein